MASHESRIDAMYARDRFAAYICVLAVWAVHQRYGVDGLALHPVLDPLRSGQAAPVYLGA